MRKTRTQLEHKEALEHLVYPHTTNPVYPYGWWGIVPPNGCEGVGRPSPYYYTKTITSNNTSND